MEITARRRLPLGMVESRPQSHYAGRGGAERAGVEYATSGVYSSARNQRASVARIATPSRLELRSVGAGTLPEIRGYAAIFNSLSVDLGGFREKIMPGAFARALREKQDVRALRNHDPNYVLGRTKTGTLKLAEDKTGLHMTIQPPDAQWVRDLLESMKRGDVAECSFAFRVRDDEWSRGSDPVTGAQIEIRAVYDLDLVDVSVVTYPAYPSTSVGLRAATKPAGPRSVEQMRRELALAEAELDLSNSIARATPTTPVSRWTKAAMQRHLNELAIEMNLPYPGPRVTRKAPPTQAEREAYLRRLEASL